MTIDETGRPAGLTVFFPAYNDGGTIASLVIRAIQTASRLTPDYEVIVIDDGSTDATADILAALQEVYPALRVITHPANRGYGGALQSGFAAAGKDLVFYTDGDAQYDPAEMSLLWRAMAPGVDLVNGYKISRSDPLHRVFIGRLYHHMVKTMFGLRVRDVDCDFRMMRRAIFAKVHLEKNSGVICLEMMKKIQDAGFAIAQVPGASLPPRVRTLPVLQLRPRLPHGPRRVPAVVRPRAEAGAPRGRREGGRGRTEPPRVVSAYTGFYRGRRVMITGGLGFIGSNIARRLVELGADVLLMDSLIQDFGANFFNIDGIADRVRVNIADVRQESTMHHLVRDREVMFNLAGQVSHIDSMRDPYTDLDINCRSQLSILEACRKHNPRDQGRLRGHAAGLRQAGRRCR